MSLKSKIEAVIYASEEPVTLQQLVGLLGEEAQAELDRIAADQAVLPLDVEAQQGSSPTPDGAFSAVNSEANNTTPLPESDEPVAEDASEAVAKISAEPSEADKRRARERERLLRDHIRRAVDLLIRDYAESDRGVEIREVASGFRMGTKPEYHDAVRGFVKSLKPALKLTLPALETLAVVAYKQPVTAAEISEIRGVDSAGVLGGLMARKLIATAGRKQVIGRPMLYKTTRDFLLRFGLKDVQELPSMEEFERMAGELVEQEDLHMEHADTLVEQVNARGDAEHIVRDEQAHQANLPAADTSNSNEAARNEISNQQATAESAAGGTHEEHTDSIQHRPAQAKTLHPTQDGEHGPADHTSRESTTREHGDSEESQQGQQG